MYLLDVNFEFSDAYDLQYQAEYHASEVTSGVENNCSYQIDVDC
jgi:hypothetical protein